MVSSLKAQQRKKHIIFIVVILKEYVGNDEIYIETVLVVGRK